MKANNSQPRSSELSFTDWAGLLVAVLVLCGLLALAWGWLRPAVQMTWPVDLLLIGLLASRYPLKRIQSIWARVANEMLRGAAWGLGVRLVLWAALSLVLSWIGSDFFAAAESEIQWTGQKLESLSKSHILGLPLFTFLIGAAVLSALLTARFKLVSRVLTVKSYFGLAKASVGIMLLLAPVSYASIQGRIGDEAARRYKLASAKAAAAQKKEQVFEGLKEGITHLEAQQKQRLFAPMLRVFENADGKPDGSVMAGWDLNLDKPAGVEATALQPRTWAEVNVQEAQAKRAETAAAEAEKAFRVVFADEMQHVAQSALKEAHLQSGDLTGFVQDFAVSLVGTRADGFYNTYLKDRVWRAALTATEFTTRVFGRINEAYGKWLEGRTASVRVAPPPEPAIKNEDALGKLQGPVLPGEVPIRDEPTPNKNPGGRGAGSDRKRDGPDWRKRGPLPPILDPVHILEDQIRDAEVRGK
jgi:hypothetical protein